MAGRVLYYGTMVSNGLILYLDAARRESYPKAGTLWADLSGNNNNGTLINGPTFNPANGGSIVFDGTNDYVSTPYFGGLLENYTFSVWFKNTNYDTQDPILVRGRDGSGNGWSVQVSLNSSGKALAAVVTTLPSLVQTTATGTTTTLLDVWYHLTGVWISNTSIQIYVNGILENTASATGRTTLRTSTDGWVLGSVSTSLYGSGNVASACIYNRALSSTEILQNYNTLKGRFGL